MNDEQLIKKLAKKVRRANETFDLEGRKCAKYPMSVLRRNVMCRALTASEEALEDANHVFMQQYPHADPVGEPGMDGSTYLDIVSRAWEDKILQDRQECCPYKDGDIIIKHRGLDTEMGVFKSQGINRDHANVYFLITGETLLGQGSLCYMWLPTATGWPTRKRRSGWMPSSPVRDTGGMRRRRNW